ncbi:MAG: hypothetical protein OEV85_14840 [Candidatus Thorarchaeota archaeon]|nr:hypothetical protein [Candidatus Thorarchaeota archaeon]
MAKLRIILSSVFAIAGYFLGLVAEATHGADSAINMASCFIKILCYIIAVSLAHSASKTIRKEMNVIGNPGLRFAGWITFAVAIGHFMTFFIWTADGSRLPDGQITIDSAMFFIASMFMISEAWNSYSSKD